MKRIAIHSAPRSGSSWLGQILNSSPKVCFRFQPLFSYAFKDYLNDNIKINNAAKANIVVKVKKEYISNSIGNGPVNALDNALRSVLIKSYPILKKMNLVDYKVRILTPDEGTKAITRVIIESTDENKNNWSTVGVSSNVINASYIALKDSITYKLIKAKTKSALG